MNNIDKLVLVFRDETDPRERDKMFLQIAGVYQGRVFDIMTQFPEHLRDEIQQVYWVFVLQCIDRWKNDGARFTTYLYPYAGIKLKGEILEKIVYKQRREPNFTTLGLYDDDGDEE